MRQRSSAATTSLRLPEDDSLTADALRATLDIDGRPFEVDVRPAQTQELASAHACEDGVALLTIGIAMPIADMTTDELADRERARATVADLRVRAIALRLPAVQA